MYTGPILNEHVIPANAGIQRLELASSAISRALLDRRFIPLRRFAPVAAVVLALDARTQHARFAEFECERAVVIGAIASDTRIDVALHDIGSRMAESIAVAGR